MKSAGNKLEFEELRSLDLRACSTVGDIIDAMRFCAFGARMLGEVARTILEMVRAKPKPTIVYSGLPDSPLGSLLKNFVEKDWCRKLIPPSTYAREKTQGQSVIVVGPFSERNAE